jgi:hypothetical protein
VSGYKTSTTRTAIIFFWRDHIAGQINMQVPLPFSNAVGYPLVSFIKSLKQDFIKDATIPTEAFSSINSTLNSHFKLKVVLLNPCIFSSIIFTKLFFSIKNIK